jgi:hypothetical protein
LHTLYHPESLTNGWNMIPFQISTYEPPHTALNGDHAKSKLEFGLSLAATFWQEGETGFI